MKPQKEKGKGLSIRSIHGNEIFRVSVGFEDPEDLNADLDQAFEIVGTDHQGEIN